MYLLRSYTRKLRQLFVLDYNINRNTINFSLKVPDNTAKWSRKTATRDPPFYDNENNAKTAVCFSENELHLHTWFFPTRANVNKKVSSQAKNTPNFYLRLKNNQCKCDWASWTLPRQIKSLLKDSNGLRDHRFQSSRFADLQFD